AQLRQQLDEIVHAIIDHEGSAARAEPLAVFLCDMPDSEAAILGAIVRPPEDGAAPGLQWHSQMLLIPGCQRGVVTRALEEEAADSSDLCHCSLLGPRLPHDNHASRNTSDRFTASTVAGPLARA